jgi:ribosomal protein S18 acetylase RimI-like enzyme
MTGTLEIRPLRARDLWPVSRLFRSAFARATGATRYRALTRREGAFVAARGADVQGFYVAWRKRDEPVVWLDYLAVSPAARGTGVGKALLGHCLGQAAAAGAEAVRLSMALGNAEAVRFYLAQGFAPARFVRGGRAAHFTRPVRPAASAGCALGWRSLREPAAALTVAAYSALLAIGDLADLAAARGR